MATTARDAGSRPARRLGPAFAASLVIALAAGCGFAPAPTPSGAASSAGPADASTFAPADVERAIGGLAGIGVETRIRSSDPNPISPVDGQPSPVRLLRLQVRNLALEVRAGGGTRGSDLDALSAAVGGGPVSPLIAAWAASPPTAAAGWAASILGERRPAQPEAAVFPTLALLAFVADASARSGGTSNGPPAGGIVRLARSIGSAGVPFRLAVADGSSFCAEVSAYLSAALNEIVEDVAEPPAWLRQLIDLYAPQYADDPGLLRRTIGAIALMSYATSLARAWAVNLTPDPSAVDYAIDGQDPVQGDVVLTVSSGGDVFGDDVAACASLAEVQLAAVPLEGSTVVWDSTGLDGHAAEVTSTTSLDDIASAGLTYETSSEPAEVASSGDPVTTQVWVSAWVNRAEMAALAGVVKSILLGEAAGTPAGPTAGELYEAIEPTLQAVMRPSGFAVIDVTYHTPKATPAPSASAADDLTGTWVGTYTLNGRSDWGFTLVLTQDGATVTGTGEVTGPTCVTSQTITGSLQGAHVHLVEAGDRDIILDGTLAGSSMSGTWTAISCGPPYQWPDTPIDGTWEATRSK